MSQQIKVSRSIDFVADADQEANIKGHISPAKLFTEYNFNELALDGTNKYTILATGGSGVSGSGGAVLTTHTDNTDEATISCGGIWWYPANSPTCEFKFRVNLITTVAIFAGFNDAVSEAAQALPFTISGTTISDTATDAAGFCFDTDQTTDYWYIVNTKNGTQGGTILASTYVPVAATQVTLRVSIDTSGNACYYYNGIQVGYKASAVTSTVPLVPYIGLITRTTVARVLTVRYCRVWGNTI
jgi:hypothetical protein